jgi:hypothetical protein
MEAVGFMPLEREFAEVIMFEVRIEEMSRSDGSGSKDYKRAVVVEAEVKEELRKTTLRSERGSALKKELAKSYRSRSGSV